MRVQTPVRFARFLAILGVGSSILLAALLFLAAFVRAILLTIDSIPVIGREETLAHLVVAAVEHADVLLIATGLLIIGIGLYSIFIGQVERLPKRLAITGLDDLKDKLAGIVVVALVVRFFTVALAWTGEANMLGFGLGIAAVILSVTAYTVLHRQAHAPGAPHATDAPDPEADAGRDKSQTT